MDPNIKRIIEITKKYGFKESESIIFLTLLLSDKPLSQKELKERLHYSTGMISTSLNSLERKGMVKMIKEGKIKRYDAIASFNLLFSNLIEQILKTDVAYALQIIREVPNKKVIQLIEEYEMLIEKSDLIKKIVNLDKESLKQIEKCLKGDRK